MGEKIGQADACARIIQTERRAFRRAVRQGGFAYSRSSDLQRVLTPKKEWLANSRSQETGLDIRRALRLALKSMLQAKREGSWRYSQARHLVILQALAGELRLSKSWRADYAATAAPSGVDGSMEPVATPSSTDIPLGRA